MSRMNPDYGEDIRILFRELDRAPAALDRSSDRDDPRDARFVRALEDVNEIRREVWIIEMGVGFDQHRRVADCRLKISDFRLAGSICNLISAICNGLPFDHRARPSQAAPKHH